MIVAVSILRSGDQGVHAARNAKKSPLQRQCSSWMFVSVSIALGLEGGCGSEGGGQLHRDGVAEGRGTPRQAQKERKREANVGVDSRRMRRGMRTVGGRCC